jgi:hypothetical protein
MDPEEDYLNIIAIEEETAASESRRKEKLDKALSDIKGSYLVRLYTTLIAHNTLLFLQH